MKLFGELVVLPRSKVNLAVNFETAIDNSLSPQPVCLRAQLHAYFNIHSKKYCHVYRVTFWLCWLDVDFVRHRVYISFQDYILV